MNRTRPVAVVAVAVVAALAYARLARDSASIDPGTLLEPPVGATLPEGRGHHHFPVKTSKPEVQRCFPRGLMLTLGFNHDTADPPADRRPLDEAYAAVSRRKRSTSVSQRRGGTPT